MTETDIHVADDDRPLFAPRATGARWTVAAIGVLLIAIGGGAYYFWQRQAPKEVPSTVPSPAAQAPASSAEPRIEHPVESATPTAPLPALAESDAAAREALDALVGASAFDALFRPQDLVRNIVATVDNLPRKNVALRLMPLKPV